MNNDNSASFDVMKSFSEYVAKKNGKLDSGHWVVKLVDNDKYEGCVYYSVHKESDEFFASFTFDLYRWDRPKMRAMLDEKFSENKRMFRKASRYSADCWLCRSPITDSDSLKNDFDALFNTVDPVIGAWREGGSVLTKSIEDGACVMPALTLPTCLSLEDIVCRIEKENIVLPAVQRGKVWNAARCATLWDSIMRRFSIGSLSVRYNQDTGKYDLLDGQQRTAAICLGFASYPPKCPQDSVLWLDLDSEDSGDCEFCFYVTTASQPWGYKRSTDETKNTRFCFSEVKEMLGDENLNWHDKNEKPYAYELWPKVAKRPVPFSLLREYFSQNKGSETLTWLGFIKWCEDKTKGDCKSWNWYKNVTKYQSGEVKKEIVAAISKLKSYAILVQDAGQVLEKDVALYFTRIGKGGVVPSNEELAYSVLKASLGAEGNAFRAGIEKAAERLGLDRSCRMASMVVRCILSLQDNRFYSGDILGKVIEETRDCSQPDWIAPLLDFVCITSSDAEDPSSKFIRLSLKINDILKGLGYTSWHITRYCQRHNGVVYQFLMMLLKDGSRYERLLKNSGLTLGGMAELLCWHTSDPAWIIRKILEKGSVAEGFAEAIQTTYYGAQRMRFPLLASKVNDWIERVSKDEKILDYNGNSSEMISNLSEGYGNEAAYSKLILACNQSYKKSTGRWNKLFEYNPSIGIWSEDVCPWDYDHILPHSWVDGLADQTDRDRNARFVNSIGNLAPIDFSMNRSLSNNPRSIYYPLSENCEAIDALQASCCITMDDAINIEAEGKAKTPDEWQYPFKERVLTRFNRIYGSWYSSLFNDMATGVSKLFNLSGKVTLKRKDAICNLVEAGRKAFYESADGKIKGEISSLDYNLDWYVWEWIWVTVDDGYEIWISKEGSCQIGHRENGETYKCDRDDIRWNDVADIKKKLQELTEKGVE